MIVMLCVSLKAVAPEVWTQELARLTECIRGISRTAGIDCEVDEELKNEVPSTVSMECDGDSAQAPLVTGLCYQVYDGLSVPSTDHEVISAFGEVCVIYMILHLTDLLMLPCRDRYTPVGLASMSSSLQ